MCFGTSLVGMLHAREGRESRIGVPSDLMGYPTRAREKGRRDIVTPRARGKGEKALTCAASPLTPLSRRALVTPAGIELADAGAVLAT
jgi:hypothetical protein